MLRATCRSAYMNRLGWPVCPRAENERPQRDNRGGKASQLRALGTREVAGVGAGAGEEEGLQLEQLQR